ncbi:MAG: Ig-like domain-containing protein, partial [Opitutaceae bacterium]
MQSASIVIRKLSGSLALLLLCATPAFAQTWTVVNDNSASITYTGSWNTVTSWRESKTAGATAELPFTGTGVRYYSKVAPGYTGQIEIYIDNVLQTTLSNTGSPQNLEFLLYEKTGLTNATHTIKVRKASGNWITVAKFEYFAVGGGGNTPPTITNIADQTITAGGNTGALAFTVGDAETAAGSLTLTKGSSNTTLVPTANIVFGGSGANRTVTVTPAAGQTGTATITVTVSDGSLTANDTFLLTVNAGGGAPTGVSLTSPAANSYLLPDARVTITASATNATSVQFKYGTTVIGTDTTAPYSIVWDLGLGTAGVIPPVGQHTLTVVASNASGSTTSAGVPVIIELFAGANTHIGIGHARANHLERLIEMNANIMRDSVNWGDSNLADGIQGIETTAGVYDWSIPVFSRLELLIADANAAGIRTESIIAYGNNLYAGSVLDSAAERTAYGNFGQAYAQRLSNNVRILSIWNEFSDGLGVPDLNGNGVSWDDATMDRYLALQQAAYSKIKAGNPQAIVTGPVGARAQSSTSTDLQDLKNLGGGAYMDWIDTHTHALTGQSHRHPEPAARWLRDSFQPVFGLAKPIIVSEHRGSVARDPLAEDVARGFMSHRTVPGVRGLIWYTMRDTT